MVDALLHIGPAHMVDDDDGRKLLQEGEQILEVLCFEIDDDMPAELRDPLGDAKEYFLGCRIDEAFYEIETHGANARRIHLFELVVADILPHDGNAARKAARRFQRIDQRIVILAVAGGLHDDIAGEAEIRSEEHTSELQSRENLVCRLLLEK